MHTESMPNVLIRDLDSDVHAVLAARAAAHGQSLQQYLTSELSRLASRPSLPEFIDDLAARPARTPIAPDAVVQAIRDGRSER